MEVPVTEEEDGAVSIIDFRTLWHFFWKGPLEIPIQGLQETTEGKWGISTSASGTAVGYGPVICVII